MSEDVKKKLDDLGKVFDTLPPFVQGRIIGAVETAQAMSRDQPQEKAG